MDDEVKPRKRPRQARSQATFDAIVEGTAQILRRDGWDDATTRRIAERAGVSEGSIYQYFPSKKALLAAVIERHLEEVAQAFTAEFAELSNASWPEPIGRLVDLAFELHQHDPELHEVLVTESRRVGDTSMLVAFEDRLVDMVEALLTSREVLRCAPRTVAFLLVHTTDAALHRALVSDDPSVDLEGVRTELIKMFEAYLAV